MSEAENISNEEESAGKPKKTPSKGKVKGPGRPPPPVEHQFKPGCAGGPGRPKGSIEIWGRIRKVLLSESKEGNKLVDLAAKAFVKEVLKGKWPQMQELINREEGKVPDRVAGADGGAVQVQYDLTKIPADDMLKIREALLKANVQPNSNGDTEHS